MKLSTVLEQVSPVRGMSSVIAAVIGASDPASVLGASADLAVTRERAVAELTQYEKALNDCQSDYAYWGFLGSVEYWRMVVNLLDAAALVGPDNLPDVPVPPRDGIVMDLLSKQADFGKRVLALAKARVAQIASQPRHEER